MVLAVLDARCGLGLAGCDVYLNVAGGLKVNEPAADLAVAAALVSSLASVPVPDETVIFGEISLSGDVRAVGQGDGRLKEAEKLGFTGAMIPKGQKLAGKVTISRQTMERVSDLVDFFLPGGLDAS